MIFPVTMLVSERGMDELRRLVREEVRAALDEREQRGLNDLMAAVSEPLDEQEEMAAVLATMTPEEWDELVRRVKERKSESIPDDIA